MDLQLHGRRALVTGSTAGIGFATARLLALEGAHVIVNGRTAARVEAAVAQIRAAGAACDAVVRRVSAASRQQPAMSVRCRAISRIGWSIHAATGTGLLASRSMLAATDACPICGSGTAATRPRSLRSNPRGATTSHSAIASLGCATSSNQLVETPGSAS